jgi:hypothetical protein
MRDEKKGLLNTGREVGSQGGAGSQYVDEPNSGKLFLSTIYF